MNPWSGTGKAKKKEAAMMNGHFYWLVIPRIAIQEHLFANPQTNHHSLYW